MLLEGRTPEVAVGRRLSVTGGSLRESESRRILTTVLSKQRPISYSWFVAQAPGERGNSTLGAGLCGLGTTPQGRDGAVIIRGSGCSAGDGMMWALMTGRHAACDWCVLQREVT